LWQSPSRGVKCKKNTLFLLYNAPVFTSKNYESQRRSWECAREFWRIAKRIQMESFCWKCTILTRSLNLVGFEFWDLSRNRKGHLSTEKCRQRIDLSSGRASFSNPSVFSCASTSTCALLPHTRVFATYFYNPTSLTFLILLPSSLSFYCKFGATALIFASLDGHTAIVQLLLGAGADKEAKDQVREKERERITHTYS